MQCDTKILKTPSADHLEGFFHAFDVLQRDFAGEKGCQTALQRVINKRQVYQSWIEQGKARERAEIVEAFLPKPLFHTVDLSGQITGSEVRKRQALARTMLGFVAAILPRRHNALVKEFAAATTMLFCFWLMSVFFHALGA